MKESPKDSSNVKNSLAVNVYTAQCEKCYKWRIIPTQEEYEEIRSTFAEDPWVCKKKAGVSCDDPAEIEYDDTRTWIIDKPNIPKTPSGFKRTLSLRRDQSRCDAYYVLPTGKKVRSYNEIERFLESNPEYKKEGKVDISNFNFTSPKVMEDTLPKNVEVKKQ